MQEKSFGGRALELARKEQNGREGMESEGSGEGGDGDGGGRDDSTPKFQNIDTPMVFLQLCSS